MLLIFKQPLIKDDTLRSDIHDSSKGSYEKILESEDTRVDSRLALAKVAEKRDILQLVSTMIYVSK